VREKHGISTSTHIVSALRMPLAFAGFASVVVATVLDASAPWRIGTLFAAILGSLFYLRLATPAGPTIDIGAPVSGRWLVVNSPGSKVPSHGVHAWAQTYAFDLVHDPVDGSRPGFGWWPIARRPQDYPGFDQTIVAPISGSVVRALGGTRDHWSRTSPLGLVYLALESVRELIGPPGVFGNHLVIQADGGACVLLAHLRRHSLLVDRGERVEAGQPVARCGNSGNSTEPHLHLQVMDRPRAWAATALPVRVDGAPLPSTGDHLLPAQSTTPSRRAPK
jgi:hypothetical protein